MALERPPHPTFFRDPVPHGPSPSSAFTQIESKLEGTPTPERGSPHCIDRKGTHPEDSGNHWQRWDENTPQTSPHSSASPQFLRAKKPPSQSQLSVGPRPQNRLAYGSRCLKPGKAPASRPAMHFTSPRHSPAILGVEAWGFPLHPRLVSELPFLERAQGPERS